jgi:hypothetical protein
MSKKINYTMYDTRIFIIIKYFLGEHFHPRREGQVISKVEHFCSPSGGAMVIFLGVGAQSKTLAVFLLC